FGLLDPVVQRLRGAADLRRNRHDRLPARRVLTLVVENQPHRALAHFRGKLVRRLAHDAPSYSGVGASGKPGAVQVLDRNVILYEGVKAVLPAHYGSGARNWTQQRLSIGERTQTTASQSMLLSASTNSKPEKPEAALQRDRQNVLMVRASPGLML